MTYLHREYGYLIQNGDDSYEAVTSDALESYLRKFAKFFVGQDSAVYVSHEIKTGWIDLQFTLDKTDCYTCEEAEEVDGVCEGHNGKPHTESVYYNSVDIYAHPSE